MELQFDNPPVYQAGEYVAPAARIADLPGPPGMPLLGNSVALVRTVALHCLLQQWATRYGQMYRIRIGREPAVVLTNPDLAGLLMRARPGEFGRSERGIRILTGLGLGGVFAAEGGQWGSQRRLMTQVLAAQPDEVLAAQLSIYAGKLVRRWQNAASDASGAAVVVDALGDLKRYATDLTTQLCFGTDLHLLQDQASEFQQDIELLFGAIESRIAAPIAYWEYCRLPRDWRIDKARARVAHWINTHIASARNRLSASEIHAPPANLLEAFVAAGEAGGDPAAGLDIPGNLTSMLFAGKDTTAHSLAWLFFLLATHREQMHSVVAQIDQVRRSTDSAMWFRDIPLLWAAIRESMRLKPIAPVLAIAPRREVQLAGLDVPANTRILLLLRPDFTGRPHGHFRVYRWLGESPDPDDAAVRSPDFAFGAGARRCPGEQLALDQIAAAAAAVLLNFEIELAVPAEQISETLNVTMRPNQLPLSLVNRKTIM